MVRIKIQRKPRDGWPPGPYTSWDPEWKQQHTYPAPYNPDKLPLAPEPVDLGDYGTECVDIPHGRGHSCSSKSSDFWEESIKSGGSQSSDESLHSQSLPAFPGEDAKTTSITGDTLSFSTTVKPSIDLNLETEAENVKPGFIAMRRSTAKIDPNKIGFLDLPGEVRNKIYDYALSHVNDYEIIWLSKGKDLTHYRHRTPIRNKPKDFIFGQVRPGDVRFNTHFVVGVQNKEAVSQRRQEVCRQSNRRHATFAKNTKTNRVLAAMNGQPTLEISGNNYEKYCNSYAASTWNLQARGFACLLGLDRQIHDEAASLFYSRSTFSFASRALLSKFLDNLTPVARANICNIHLVHDMENVSFLKGGRVFKDKERQKLIACLQTMASECKSLRKLRILVNIRGSHLRLELAESWAKDLVDGLENLENLEDLKIFDLDLIFADDSSNVSAANALRPRNDEKVSRSTQLVDAADMVRRAILKEDRFKELELIKQKCITKARVLNIRA